MHLKSTGIIPPKHLCQLKTRAIPLTLAQSGQEFAVHDIFVGVFINIP
jgi:hypothetical protein